MPLFSSSSKPRWLPPWPPPLPPPLPAAPLQRPTAWPPTAPPSIRSTQAWDTPPTHHSHHPHQYQVSQHSSIINFEFRLQTALAQERVLDITTEFWQLYWNDIFFRLRVIKFCFWHSDFDPTVWKQRFSVLPLSVRVSWVVGYSRKINTWIELIQMQRGIV